MVAGQLTRVVPGPVLVEWPRSHVKSGSFPSSGSYAGNHFPRLANRQRAYVLLDWSLGRSNNFTEVKPVFS